MNSSFRPQEASIPTEQDEKPAANRRWFWDGCMLMESVPGRTSRTVLIATESPDGPNARLLSAAPMLLAAADAAMRFYDAQGDDHRPGECRVLDDLSNAIRRAQGEPR